MIKKLLFLLLVGNVSFAQLTDPNPTDNWAVSQIGSNSLLDNPYTLLYGPDGYLWITERANGEISRFNASSGAQDLLVDITAVYSTAGQDGLMGMALHPQLGQGTGNDYVYVAYTYNSSGRKLRISRFTYSITGNNGVLGSEMTLLQGLPASNDHNSGRLVIGPDLKLYYSIGDQGNNQFGNACTSIKAQVLPVSPTDYSAYQGKILRINLDGSVPADNPTLSGVVSHVYSYGHRNAQGLVFGSNGKLYASEHGPKSDDELNTIESGKNYGWPHIAGYNDNMAYTYCNWSTASPCNSGNFSDHNCPATVTPALESSWAAPVNYKNPIATWGTVDNSYNFQAGCGFVCWPTVGPSGMRLYEYNLIPGWGTSVLSTTLKRGRIYRATLSADGESVMPIANPEPDGTNDDFEELWYTQNRYRDIVAAPDGITFYIITDSSGSTSGPSNNNSISISNPGIIIKVQYTGTVLGNSDFRLAQALQLVPNPATTTFKLSTNDQSTVVTNVKILDVNGRLVKEIQAPVVNQPISVEELSKGMYLVNVSDANGFSVSKKLVVK
ncbi:quinoprotein glucose dehydrogenase [Flavobacterium limnosediminis JC2902]|uniref:Quinoprotein glucose dehydrogenase n=1 Tax=Flavobacterium limnosediminis JC2902 TaxID=1341181 RepID=V6SXJ4_9FLAO|nr:glucose/sorbosone family PQQ-dependent dehydrogenase [Flavobacterium limnosediminis]ESU29130.1 quinoprotein glucose dehydrogenase [Flavobacterium limnosediminis JC2902]